MGSCWTWSAALGGRTGPLPRSRGEGVWCISSHTTTTEHRGFCCACAKCPLENTELTIRGGAECELEALYQASYPDTVFSAWMVQTGWYYGIRHGQAIVSVAGVHVYSSVYKVAALGNVTTHPDWRGRGLGRAVCASLN